MNTIIQINIPYPILRNHLDVVLEKRLNPEIYFTSDTLDRYELKEIQRIANALADHHLSVTTHGPFMDLSPGGPDGMVRKVTVERFSQALEVASYFQPRAIVFHAGYNRWYFNGNSELWLERSLLTWESILEKARERKIPVALENVFEEEPSALRNLISALENPLLGICFDLGHFHLFSKVSLREWFDALGTYVIELHLHDNHKNNDDHLPLGEGEINFDEFFELLQQYSIHPIYTIEPHRVNGVEKSLEVCWRYLGITGTKTGPFPSGMPVNLL